MNVTFACPKCDAASRAEFSPSTALMVCSHCGQEMQIPEGAVEQDRVNRCLACPSTDLFIRKDFPQRLGVTIVTVGLLASCVAWAYSLLYVTFAILFATAAIDLLLYLVVPDALMCYRCGAMYRGVVNLEEHASFNLETHERHRQQRIRLAEAMRPRVRSQELGVSQQ